MALAPPVQWLAVDELEHEHEKEEAFPGYRGLVNPHDVRVVHRRGEPSFAREAGDLVDTGRAGEHLEGEVGAVDRPSNLVHYAHATGADRSHDMVEAVDNVAFLEPHRLALRGREASERVGQLR